MTDKSGTLISEEEAERLKDLDSIPGFAEKLSAALRQVFEMSGVDVADTLDFVNKLSMMPEEELRAKLHANCLQKIDPAFLGLICDVMHCAGAINRHDDFEASERFVQANGCETLPWIWVTGEPNSDRRKVVSLILTMCSKRSLDHSGMIDCQLEDLQLALEQLFGSYFDTAAGNETLTGRLHELNNGFLLFYKAESMPLPFQKKLLIWKERCRYRRESAGRVHTTRSQNQSEDKTENAQKLARLKEYLELLDVALFFIADRPPQALVEQGIVMRELVSGSIHIPVPPLRECPKLALSRLRSFIVEKPTLTSDVSDPLKYWSDEALEVVSSFHWPDNLAGLRGLVDTLYFKGVLRSRKDRITADHVRGALWEMYDFAPPAIPELPAQTGSTAFELPAKVEEPPPDRSKWIEIFQEKYQGKPGAVSKMAQEYAINRSLLSTVLNEAGINTGKGGRPRKDRRAPDA